MPSTCYYLTYISNKSWTSSKFPKHMIGTKLAIVILKKGENFSLFFEAFAALVIYPYQF